MSSRVRVRREPTVIPTYEPAAPDPNPMFLEKRVYQGSSGKVYPLPFIDRIAEAPTDREWDAIYLENEFVSLMMLPEIGGRIHMGKDLTNGYDFFYHQHVLKPALVGLAGPWASGGVELNWPQHHRPATFMPTDVYIEHGDDGSITAWMGDHEPMNRMKGMHGVCLHPGRSVIELKVRLYNRTQFTQTFLWWANIATHVHQGYKSFFPPDAHMVADHAKRATSNYPLCKGYYYGVNYGERAVSGVPDNERPAHFLPSNSGGEGPDYAPNDLSWYSNIPVPTSYMCMGTEEDFFGGYDYFARAGLLHIADHHIAPGKKQWTWGNHEFGYAWDRNLTDSDGPYIELMAGVYTDNQPDFSFIAPGETKTFSQFWYPYQSIGPVQYANLDAALSISDGKVGVAVTRPIPRARVEVYEVDKVAKVLLDWTGDLSPGTPFVEDIQEPPLATRMVRAESWEGAGGGQGGVSHAQAHDLKPEPALATRMARADSREGTNGALLLILSDADGKELARFGTCTVTPGKTANQATEPPLPKDISSTDELYLTGLHLEQYRHATRSPIPYWQEALSRDPGDARCNNAMGLWHLRRGEFHKAKTYFERAIERLTFRNPNPYDGEPYYNLGLTLRYLQHDKEANDAFGKAVWNSAWQAPGYHAMAELACTRFDYVKALDYVDRSLRKDADNIRARNLKAMILTELGRAKEAKTLIAETLALDPLDWWARFLNGQPLQCDNAVRIDLTIDLMRAGFEAAALAVLDNANLAARDGTVPMVHYYRAWVLNHSFWVEGQEATADRESALAYESDPRYCFPSRLEDLIILEDAAGVNLTATPLRSPSEPPLAVRMVRAEPREGAGGGQDGVSHAQKTARAAYYLGNLLYDRRRHEEAIAMWQIAVNGEPDNAIAHRNLGIGFFNVLGKPEAAKTAYENAVQAAPDDARLRYERDQLWKRIGISPSERLDELKKRLDLVEKRDDLTLEYCNLLNAEGRHEEAARVMSDRKFQPWEGGEGQALGAFARTHLILGRQALSAGDASKAADHFQQALQPPENLSEARHLLANASDLWLAMGDAENALGNPEAARKWWTRAAEFEGDFQEMSVVAFSELTYFQALALRRLGREEDAVNLLRALDNYAEELGQSKAKIDYFATSLPTMLLFDDDLQKRQNNAARFMRAQAATGLDRREAAVTLLNEVLTVDPNHALANDLRKELMGA